VTVGYALVPPNHPPAAAADSYDGTPDTPLTIAAPGVLANDSDADGDPLTAVLVASPAHGAVVLGADGGFSYTPAAGYSGADSFTYRASDGEADSNVATVTLTIAATPAPQTDVIVSADQGTPRTTVRTPAFSTLGDRDAPAIVLFVVDRRQLHRSRGHRRSQDRGRKHGRPDRDARDDQKQFAGVRRRQRLG
jgi:hypothetical protein